MNDLEKYRSSNLVILEKDVEVDCIEWSCSHPGCDALYLDDSDYSKMNIVVYALNDAGNKELRCISEENPELKLFVGIDKSMLNFGGGALL